MTIRWAILTGEYPPQHGGVADYTHQVAHGLAAAGDLITVYAPGLGCGPEPAESGVSVVRLPDHFGPRGLLALDYAIARRPRPDRVLVQYVPHAFGWKAMNVPFALWVACRARRLAPVWVMFHEVAFPFSWRPVKYAVLGAVTRVMARLVVGGAERVFVSIPAWGNVLKRIHPGSCITEWLPVPCTLEATPSPESILAARTRFATPETQLVGHFGTFGCLITDLLVPSLLELLRLEPTVRILLVGRGSVEFVARFTLEHPEATMRVAATGDLSAVEVSTHLQACDVLIQPYPDGVTTRRTSAMAGLAVGVPVVTNLGFLSEPVWTCGAVVAAPMPDPSSLAHQVARLLKADDDRLRIGEYGQRLYQNTFAINHTVSLLRTLSPRRAGHSSTC